jgi:hypothetical protein
VSRLGAQAGRAHGFCGDTLVNKGFVAVRAEGDLRRKSSKYVQCGEPQIVALKSKHFSSSSLRKSLKM